MKTPLDRIDFEILAALQEDARLSNKELAARIGLAPSTCLVRVRRLVEAGVLRGFHADIDPAALGVGLMAMISVRLSRHARDTVETFRQHVLSLPEVASQVLAAFRQMVVDEYTQSIFSPLSPRELEVLEFVAAGRTNKEIALLLDISNQTVKNHVSSILRKLAVNDRTQAVVYAMRRGWIKVVLPGD